MVTNDESTCSFFETTLTGTPSPWSMAPALIDRYDLLRGVKKLGTWWEWSELFFGNGFDLSMHRHDCTDAVWAATLAANKGPGQWYADSDSLRYSFFDKVEDEDDD